MKFKSYRHSKKNLRKWYIATKNHNVSFQSYDDSRKIDKLFFKNHLNYLI